MKKIVIVLATSASLVVGISTSNASPAKSGVIITGEGSYSKITQESSITLFGTNLASFKSDNPLGVGAYLAYDYAFSEHITGGIKTGYNYTSKLATLKIFGAQDINLDSSSIPILLTGKYFFDTGFYAGAEAGVQWQKLKSSNSTDSETYSWNIAPVIGALGGYQWENGLSISGSIDYILGKKVDLTSSSDQPDLSKNALANVKFGLQVNYLLPI